MRYVEAYTIDDVIQQLGISKKSFYRWRAKGLINDEIELIDNTKVHKIRFYEPNEQRPVKTDSKIQSIFSHRRFLKEWVEWRENGLGIRPSSQTYKRSQLEYIGKYFARYDLINAESLSEWLKETEPTRGNPTAL